MMLRLPPLEIAGRTVRLPLPEAEACRLYEDRTSPSWLAWQHFSAVGHESPLDGLFRRAAEVSWRPLTQFQRESWESWRLDARAERLPLFANALADDAPAITGDSEPPPFAILFTAGLAQFAAAVEQAKLQALYHFVYGLSHEFNNPLANIATRAQTLLRDESDPERRRKLSIINAQAFRAHEMLADVMLFAKPPALQPGECDLVVIARDVLRESAADAHEQGTTLELTSPETLPWVADAVQLGVALKALVRNALEAVRIGGRVEIEVCGSASGAVLEIRDNGPGIPADIRPFVFNPFFSGREAGRGLGVGLSKCWKIVELHGGTLTLDSPPAGGTAIRMFVPLKCGSP